MAKIQCVLKLPPSNQKGMCYEAKMYRDIQIQVNPIPAMSTDIIFKKCKPSHSLMALLQSLCIKLGMRVPWNSHHIKGFKISNASRRISKYRCFKQKKHVVTKVKKHDDLFKKLKMH